MNNRKIMILLVIILCITAITFSYSYITLKFESDNIITFGSIKMKLMQKEVKDSKEFLVDNKNTINITGRKEINRKVYIQNVGNENIYVRISLDTFLVDNDGNKKSVNDLIRFDINDNYWIYKDGWYYYKNILKYNEDTPNLFTKIMFDEENITKEYEEGTIDLDITAQGVQSANNSSNVLDAEGWPAK